MISRNTALIFQLNAPIIIEQPGPPALLSITPLMLPFPIARLLQPPPPSHASSISTALIDLRALIVHASCRTTSHKNRLLICTALRIHQCCPWTRRCAPIALLHSNFPRPRALEDTVHSIPWRKCGLWRGGNAMSGGVQLRFQCWE
jgi:hypothetical protein